MSDRRHDSEDDFEAEGIPGIADVDSDVTGTGIDGGQPPRDHPVAADDFGTTALEEERGESLAHRLARELPDDVPAPTEDELGGDGPEESALHIDPDS